MVAAIRDNSAERDAETAHAEVELRFRVAFEDDMAPMMFTDPEDRTIAVNDALCQMVGYSREEIVGHDSKLCTYPEDIGITEESLRASRPARPIRSVASSATSARTVESWWSGFRGHLRDASGKARNLVFSGRAITEERAQRPTEPRSSPRLAPGTGEPAALSTNGSVRRTPASCAKARWARS